MTTPKLDKTDGPPPASRRGHIHLRLSENEVLIRRSGLEFLSVKPVPLWAEVTVDLRSPQASRPLRAEGVVVDCTGSRHSGYTISVLFLALPAQSEHHLRELAVACAT